MKKRTKNTSFFKTTPFQMISKILLSLYIFYHLAAVFITPQKISMFYKHFKPYLISYAQTLSLQRDWNFYALKRAHYYNFEYIVINGKNKVEKFLWPPSRKEVKRIYLNHNRLIRHSRFFMTKGRRYIRRHFIPYLCDLHPSANKITIKAVLKRPPRLKNAFHSPIYDNPEEWFSISSRCSKRKKARNIDHFLEDKDPLIEDIQ